MSMVLEYLVEVVPRRIDAISGGDRIGAEKPIESFLEVAEPGAVDASGVREGAYGGHAEGESACAEGSGEARRKECGESDER